MHLCLKIEKKDPNKPNPSYLYCEAKLYPVLHEEEGFPRAHQFYEEKAYNYLAMELLGPNLLELLEANGGKFSLKCVCIIASQMITRLESLHKHDFIHRDVKPENFLIGRNKKASMIYLCDLGLCKRYRDSDTKVHVPYQTNRPFAGTARYITVRKSNGLFVD